MPVSMKRKSKAEKAADAVAEVAPSVSSVKHKGETFEVMLGNDCQRYVDPHGRVYEAGKRYKVTKAQREKLFDYMDDNSVRYFYDSEIVLRQINNKKTKARKAAAIEDGKNPDEEIDTGAVALADDKGRAVGVRGGDTGDQVAI